MLCLLVIQEGDPYVTRSHKMVNKSIFGATEILCILKEEKMLIIMVKKILW